MKKDLYLAAPLFTEQDNKELDLIESLAKEEGLTFYSPRLECAHLNGRLDSLKGIKPEDMTQEQLELRQSVAKEIVRINIECINNVNYVFGNIRDNDRGTIWELGYAVGRGIPTITYSFHQYFVNMMIGMTVVRHISDASLENYDSIRNLFKKLKTEEHIDTQLNMFSKTEIQ